MLPIIDVGALVGAPSHRESLARYGHNLGMAFQIADDLLDYTGTEAVTGKPTGHDLYEGVYTLPVLRTLAHDTAASGELRDLLGHPIEGVELEKALGIVRSNGGVPDAVAAAKAEVDAACAALDGFPGTPATDALRAGAAHLVSTLA